MSSGNAGPMNQASTIALRRFWEGRLAWGNTMMSRTAKRMTEYYLT